MKDVSGPVPPEDVRNLLRRCLQKAAHINYRQLLDYAQIKGTIKGAGSLETSTHRLSVQEPPTPAQTDAWTSC